MEKAKRIPIWVMLIVLSYASGAFALDAPNKVFSGTVFRVDREKQELGVENKYDTVIFKWNGDTQFSPGTLPENLKQGTRVFVYFAEGSENKLLASRIEINRRPELKGFQLPFDCGLTVC